MKVVFGESPKETDPRDTKYRFGATVTLTVKPEIQDLETLIGGGEGVDPDDLNRIAQLIGDADGDGEASAHGFAMVMLDYFDPIIDVHVDLERIKE